jgi:hypothetical protein
VIVGLDYEEEIMSGRIDPRADDGYAVRIKGRQQGTKRCSHRLRVVRRTGVLIMVVVNVEEHYRSVDQCER